MPDDPRASRCPVCDGDDVRTVFDLRDDVQPLSVPGWIACCVRCGMWYKVEAKRDHHLKVYGGEYAKSYSEQSYHSSKAARQLFRRVLRGLRPRERGDSERRLKLLDVGTGTGTMLEVASAMGFDAEGIDASPGLVEEARKRGARARCMRVEDLEAENSYDVVTMMDLIEHLREPMAALRSAHRWLKADGEVVIYTPNHRSAVVDLAKALEKIGVRGPLKEIFGGNHLCFFDTRTLSRALESAGFAPGNCSLFPYNPARPGKRVSLVNLVGVTAVEWLGAPFRRVFRMIYYAKKTDAIAGEVLNR